MLIDRTTSVARHATGQWPLKASRNGRGAATAAAIAALGLSAVGASAASADVGPAPGQTGGYTFVDEDLGNTTASVNVATGNMLVTATDLAPDPATANIPLTRYYNSQSSATGALGPRWSFNAGPDVSLTDNGTTLTIHGASGYTATLDQEADGSFDADSFDGFVTKDSSGYVLHLDEGDAYTFDASGAMAGYADAEGNAFTAQSTSAAGHTILSSFGTTAGQRVNFSYNGNARAIEADDPASHHRLYGYDGQQRLTSSSAAEGTTLYSYGADGNLATIQQPDGTSTSITYTGAKVAAVSVTHPSGPATGATYAYAAPTDDECTTDDVGQTTVTPSDGSPATVYCYTADGIVDSVDDPTDSVNPDGDALIDPASPACAATPDGIDARCSNQTEVDPDADEGDDGAVSFSSPGFLPFAATTSQVRTHISASPRTTIRSSSGSFAVGAAKNGWTFDRVAQAGSSRFGTVYGTFNGCGWVRNGNAPDPKKPQGKPHSGCDRNGGVGKTYPLEEFAKMVNCDGPSKTQHCNVVTGGLTLAKGTVECFNVGAILHTRGKTKPCPDGDRRTLTEAHGLGAGGNGHDVGWRYITRDGRYVGIKDGTYSDNRPAYVFVKRSALPADLCPVKNDEYETKGGVSDPHAPIRICRPAGLTTYPVPAS
jgi:YD repeat-containing protein